MNKLKLLSFLLVLSSTLYGQEKASKFLIFPGCEKFEAKGNQKLIDCYGKNFNELFTYEVKQVLNSYNLSVDNVNINAKIKYEISKEGEYQNLEIIGTEAEKSILHQSFYNYVIKLKEKGKIIIPAKSKTGEPALLRFDIPFRIINH